MSKFRRLGKLMVLVLVVIIIALPTACSKQNDDSGSTTQVDQSPVQSTIPEEVVPEDGPLTKYKDPVIVESYTVTDGSTKFIDGETIDNNIQTQMNKEHLNIEYINKFTVDSAKSEEKINLVIASNDLPDFTKVNINQLQLIMRAGQAEDLTPFYDKYTSDSVKKVLEFQDKVSFVPAMSEGKMFAAPLPNDFANDISIMYIRKDWLKKLNLNAPTTLDELAVVGKAFVEQDPDGNNKKDTIAIGWNNDSYFETFTANGIANPLKAYPKSWVKNASGNLVYGSVQPEMKTALAKLQDFYKTGLFEKEYAVADMNKMTEQIAAAKVGIVFGPFWFPDWPLAMAKDTEKAADWGAYPIPQNSDGQHIVTAKPFTYSWVVVRKGYKNPEACLKSMNLWHEMYFGTLSSEFLPQYFGKYDGLNVHNYAKPFFFDVPDLNLKLGIELRPAFEKEDESLLKTDNAKAIWKKTHSAEATAMSWSQKLIYTESEKVLLENYKNLMMDQFNYAPTPTMITKKATLDKLELELFTKIIMGSPIDDFDSFVDQWHKLGGDEITNEVNDLAKK